MMLIVFIALLTAWAAVVACLAFMVSTTTRALLIVIAGVLIPSLVVGVAVGRFSKDAECRVAEVLS